MESENKADLRLVYLAFHHIVKYRGNFLHESEGVSLKAQNANASGSAQELAAALKDYFEDVFGLEEAIDPDVRSIRTALEEQDTSRGNRATSLRNALGARDADSRAKCRLVARACVGYKIEYSKLFVGLDTAEGTKFSLADEGTSQAFVDDLCPDEARALFDAIRSAYSAFVLSGVLCGATSISESMVRSYDRHSRDLALLKSLFRDYLPHDQYLKFFRGPLSDLGDYDINELQKGSYTSYIAGDKLANGRGTTHEELIKEVKALCDSCPTLKSDERYAEIRDRIEAGEESDFLLKQRTRANGSIPYQLHLEEMEAIINRQAAHYPFLEEYREELKKLVSSRIPYYVGPLNGGHDPLGCYPNNNVDDSRKFGWSVRLPGKESAKAYPWNIDEVIDTDKTAERFIRKMTGSCTYLFGEPVLPRHSLLYEEFCVLNELNGARWGRKGGRLRRFDHIDKVEIFNSLFLRRRSANVSYGLVKKWLLEERGVVDADVRGGQGETSFESKMGTYHDFCKVFGVRSLAEESPLTMEELEEIVLWNTVFEDRDIFRRKLREKYGPDGDGRLSVEQIKKIASRRYTGWGRLSRTFLTGIRVPANVPAKSVSIMDVLRGGNPYEHLRQLVLMETISDRNLDFAGAIDAHNQRKVKEGEAGLTIDDLQGSPANRRSVNQALRILDEIVSIVGKPPARICIEVTRDDDLKRKGNRTKRRYNRLHEALAAYRADASLMSDLEDNKSRLDDDRLMLYFEQQGKCMYSGEPLDITRLSSYEIDHILPQSYIKDDSLDNRVLVKRERNQRKLDSLLLSDETINARIRWWGELRRAKLLSEKKYERLTCRNLSERQINGFINRQLVETSQIVKFVRQMCEQRYPATEVVSVRANVSHGVRENLGLVKCRELNDYHHAHDAYIACQVADFVGRCYPHWQDGFSLAVIRKYIASLNGGKSPARMPGRSGFIADSMTKIRHVDTVTGEVLWDNSERNALMRKCLGYKMCFVSKMTEVLTGAFWDETIYSPRDKKNGRNLSVPLKSSGLARNHEGYLDPRKYGGVNNVKQAYWFIFAAKDGQGDYEYFFEGIPKHLSRVVDGALQAYADELAAKARCGEATILRARVPLSQKFELDGTPYTLGGKTRKSNEIVLAHEMCGSNNRARLFSQLMGDDSRMLSSEEMLEMYDWLTEQAWFISPKLAKVLKLEEKRALFSSLAIDDEVTVLKNLSKRLNGAARDVDLRLIGGAKQAGKLSIPIASNLQSIVWIDQSVTGMFERRTSFEDLCRGL